MQSFWDDLIVARRRLTPDRAAEIVWEWRARRDRVAKRRFYDRAAAASELVADAYFLLEDLESCGWNRCYAAAYWIKAGQMENALQVMKESRVRFDPESEGEILARAHRAMGQPECALDVLHRAIQVRRTPKLLELRAEVFCDLGADEECVRDYAAACHLRAKSGEKDLHLSILRMLEVADRLCRRKEAEDLVRVHYETWLAGLLRRRPRR